MMAGGAAMNAQAATNLANFGAQISAARAANSNPGTHYGMSPQQALQASQPQIRNLAHAAQGIAQQIAAQQAAAAAAAVTPSNVPNGLAPGGLQVAAGAGSDVNNDAVLWLNASQPMQSVASNGHVNVTIQQTSQNAILTWQTMNVGPQTTLNFDQSAGTQTNGANNWVVLNRIEDPSGRPSQILGNITAQGSVYVINRNGILFGAGSQVNVHSLVASSLTFLGMNDDPVQTSADVIASNQQFMSEIGGLAEQESTTGSIANGSVEVLGLATVTSVTGAGEYPLPGDVTIEPGASITTQANGTVSDGGFVMIAAPNVNNGGTITTTNGQAILAAGIGVALLPSKTNVFQPVISGQLQTNGDLFEGTDVTPAGTLTNTGLIQADKGYITLIGSNINQNGVVGVTTGVSYPGAITISAVDEAWALNPAGVSLGASDPRSESGMRRAGVITFGPGSVTGDLPEEDGETTTSDVNATFTPGSITLTGGSIWFQGGSLIEAPGGTVSVAALSLATAPPGDTAVQGRIYLDSGAAIDVSGLSNVELPIADELVTIPLIGQNELADSPLLRDGFLYGLKNVVVDSTLSGTNADGSQWVGSPVLNLSGYVSLIPRTIDQLLTNGGTITLSGSQVMTAAGSSLSLNGGYLHYDGGIVDTTRLVDASGAIVPIGQASPFDTFVGVTGEFVESHPRWGVTTTWYDPLLTGGVYEPDFIVGGDAGILNVFASQALVLDGTITAQAFGGSKQVQDNARPSGGTFALGADSAISQTTGGTSQDPFNGEPGSVSFENSAPQLDDLVPGFNFNTPFDAQNPVTSSNPSLGLPPQVVPVDTLNSAGFSAVSVTEDLRSGGGITVAQGTQLAVQPGGSITFTASAAASITVLGSLLAPAGDISLHLQTGGTTPIAAGLQNDIIVGPDALISVAGQWVNDSTLATGVTDLQGSEYINGGSISLAIDNSASAVSGEGTTAHTADATGSIVLQAGSVLDASSGGYLQPDGQLLMKNGVAQGMGGSVSLMTYHTVFGGESDPSAPDLPPLSQGQLVLDGTIRSRGFAGGGTLTLEGLGFQVGGDPSATPTGYLYLPADFFENQGFGKYVLDAAYGANVAAGTTVRVTQQDMMPNLSALQSAATGADLSDGNLSSPGTVDAYDRQPTSLVIAGGGAVQWSELVGPMPAAYAAIDATVSLGQGAQLLADAGASIGLFSPAQVTVLGSIIAPGGAITLSADTGGQSFDQGALVQNHSYTTSTQSVWLGPDAVLDVAGVALDDPIATPQRSGSGWVVPSTGRVLPGGSVTLSDDQGYVVAQAGATIDVSGTSANFDEPQAGGVYVSQPVWSDAGSILLGAGGGLDFDGTLVAHAGSSHAQGGTLTILPEQDQPGGISITLPGGMVASAPGATALVIQQSGSLVPAGLAPGDAFGTPTGVIEFSADRLQGSGISTLVLGNSGTFNEIQPVPIIFAGNVDVSLSNALIVNTGQIVALSTDQVAQLATTNPATGHLYTVSSLLAAQTPGSSIGAPVVTLDAPYVAFVGPQFSSAPASTAVPSGALADGTLEVNAAFIDLENEFALANIGQATFGSSGDIRLSTTNASNSTFADGELFTPGNLTFKASDVYPASDNTFILDAVGPAQTGSTAGSLMPTTITFLSNGGAGASDVPLSAGGTLLIDATNIVQGGTVRAPSGTLVFGVGNAADQPTRTQFGNLPLTATQSVTLAPGSITSVSDDNTVIPFGTTVDGTEWQYNTPGQTNPDLAAPPAKFISVNGSNVALQVGATIDLSGGGDLQAEEWVPGTGGSRDLLSQYNVSYATNSAGTAVPLNVGGANVYAVVPGYHAPVAAYDPVFAQVTQPLTGANGATQISTTTLGVGRAGVGDALGDAVYLSGVPGLPAGVYTLLPAKYATLPGAFRVTVSSDSGPVMPGAAETLPDGTVVVAGYAANALSGARSATPTLFDVQSGAVWQQYSQYTLTSANSFFPSLAASAGNVAPQLPMDGGQLVIAAVHGLSLGATLDASAANGGAPAEVDLASQDIQITGNGQAALPGYLQISADQLDALGAGSLLIGGTRTQTSSGITINAIANGVVVSNDAADPLTGSEIILVTKTDPSGADANAATGLQVDAGSVIAATGTYPAAKDVPITIGQLANTTTNTAAVSGDGALLAVSSGGDSVVTRLDTTGTGLLTVQADAVLTGGQALTLDSSGNLTFDSSAMLSGRTIAVDGSAITFTDQPPAAAASLPGFVVGATQLAQLANAQQVILRSSGAMNFDGSVDVTFGNSVDLSAGAFVSDGGSVTINAPEVAFTNELNAPVPVSVSGGGTLTVNAGQIDFGTGPKTVIGLGTVTMNASGGIVGQGTGTFDFGALPVTLNAPVYLADTGSASTIKTSGELDLNGAAGTALALQPLGGALSFVGGSINDNGAQIEAPAGNVSLEATTGNLTIGGGSLLSTAGVSKQFFDVTAYAPAGALTLTADAGTVDVQAGSTLDFAGAQGGGAAGTLTLSAPQQTVQLAGTINGSAAAGNLGGSFSLNSGGAVDLDDLAAELASSGVDDAISVQTNTGNLTLSAGSTLTAHEVSLTADGGPGGKNSSQGQIQIFGTIDASGVAGGEIDLYGKSLVDLEGSLIATGSSATQRGGTVNIGTTGTPGDIVTLDPTYGYENISSDNAGMIELGSTARINVSGGTAGGLSGGTVSFRTPLLEDNGGVNMTVDSGAQITGAGSVGLEAFAVWSTTDPTTNGNAEHFDGIIDPAGWYNDQGKLLAGTFTDQSGNTIGYTPGTYVPANGTTAAHWIPATLSNDPGATWADIKTDLANDLSNDAFAPNMPNTDHQTFYGYQDGDATAAIPGTLMGFVNQGVSSVGNPFAAAGIVNVAVIPGIELDNPSSAINNGNISVLTNWNLGAGTSPTNLAFRYNGQAPVITLRAENNVKLNASLSDGFFQIGNPTGPAPIVVAVPGPSDYSAAESLWTTQPYGFYTVQQYAAFYTNLQAPQVWNSGDPKEIAQYYGLYADYLSTLLSKDPVTGFEPLFTQSFYTTEPVAPGQPVFSVPAPTAQQELADPTAYLHYLGAWEASYNAVQVWQQANPQVVAHIDWLQAPPAVLTSLVTGSSLTFGTSTTDNTPSPLAQSGNWLPMLSASLEVENSSSYRIVSGANLASANPLAVQAASLFGSDQGSVSLNGHFSYLDSNSLPILAPTTIRTGTGSIDIAAAGDLTLLDPTAPGVIYTGGAPAAGTPASSGTDTIIKGFASQGVPDILVTPNVSPDSGGDISIQVQGNITGVQQITDTTGSLTGRAGADDSQYWWQWLEVGPQASVVHNGQTDTDSYNIITQSSIDFGAFDQGVMSAGGNVTVSAGGNISDLAVSLPTTWYLSNNNTTLNTVGGGNLTVTAGGNIMSGDYFVAKGTGTITAGGQIGSDLNGPALSNSPINPLATVLATIDGVLDVNARQGAAIGAVVDPSYIDGKIFWILQHPDLQGYSANAAVNVSTTTGDLVFGGAQYAIAGNVSFGPVEQDYAFMLPPTLSLTALSGGITVASGGELYPSAIGELSLIADQSIVFSGLDSGTVGSPFTLSMADTDPALMPSPTNQTAIFTNSHDSSVLHGDDPVPARIYSLDGSIVDGALSSAGLYTGPLAISLDKAAQIYAGVDIVNLDYLGQNLREDDVTRIVAGRNIYDAPAASLVLSGTVPNVPSLQLGGPGTFDIEAGGNIGPLIGQGNPLTAKSPNTGIDAIGNADNAFLPHESANVQVLYGVGPGIDNADFIAAYIDPAGVPAGVPSTAPALIAFMEQYDTGQVENVDTGFAADKTAAQQKVGTLTAAQAWSQFQALPGYVQQIFVQQVLFSVLTDVGNDYNNAASPFFQQYARGYQAINTLFPASYGYTANDLSGGANGANELITTGNLDIRSSTIQTEQGGSIAILGPGGQALVGSSSAPPDISSPNLMGILTLEQGDIDIFTDRSLLLAQSRIFTEQGGGMTIWSSNGDINAGKGSKSVADLPPPIYVCDINHYCTIDARGEVTGAGIATLQTIPGAAPGDVNLIAPRGTVDAGDAGIRVSGNLNVAALHVANVDNIQVQGKSTGIPVVQAVDTGALTAASAATSAVTQMAQNLVKSNASGVLQRHWIITVQVEGFGESPDGDDSKHKRKPVPVSYNPLSQVSILGVGGVGETQHAYLTKEEQGRLGKL